MRDFEHPRRTWLITSSSAVGRSYILKELPVYVHHALWWGILGYWSPIASAMMVICVTSLVFYCIIALYCTYSYSSTCPHRRDKIITVGYSGYDVSPFSCQKRQLRSQACCEAERTVGISQKGGKDSRRLFRPIAVIEL